MAGWRKYGFFFHISFVCDGRGLCDFFSFSNFIFLMSFSDSSRSHMASTSIVCSEQCDGSGKSRCFNCGTPIVNMCFFCQIENEAENKNTRLSKSEKSVKYKEWSLCGECLSIIRRSYGSVSVVRDSDDAPEILTKETYMNIHKRYLNTHCEETKAILSRELSALENRTLMDSVIYESGDPENERHKNHIQHGVRLTLTIHPKMSIELNVSQARLYIPEVFEGARFGDGTHISIRDHVEGIPCAWIAFHRRHSRNKELYNLFSEKTSERSKRRRT